MSRKGMWLSGSLLFAPALGYCDTPAMLELRRAAALSESSVRAASNEDAAAAYAKWVENAAEVPSVRAAAAVEPPPIETVTPAPARPTLLNAPLSEPEDPLPPPRPKGWKGFTLGFLGMEAKALSLLSGTGKAAIPLMILLQPLILPLALFAGLLGLVGVRL